MKIRVGFVSNSSSASYIITLRGTRKDIEEVINEACATSSWDNNIESVVENNITRLENSLRDLESGRESFLSESIDDIKANLELHKSYKTFLNGNGNINRQELFTRMVLSIFGICRTNLDNGDVQLNYFTAMHNSYTEGMPRVLKEIVLYALFELSKVKINCVIERDN